MPLQTTNQYNLGVDVLGAESRGMQLGQQRQQVADERQQRQLLGQMQGEVDEQKQAIAEMFTINPELAGQMEQQLGLDTESKKRRAADFGMMLEQTPFEYRGGLIQQRIAEIQQYGGNPSDTMEMLQMNEDEQNAIAKTVQMLALTPGERNKLATGQNSASSTQFGSSKTIKDANGNYYQVTDKRNPSTGETMSAYAPMSPGAPPQPVGNIELVADSGMTPTEGLTHKKQDATHKQEQIRLSRAISAGIKAGESTFKDIAPVDQAIGLIDEAIQEIDNGAETGFILDMLPTVREASKSLENVKNRMGLNVVSSVTFGALSEGELKLAMSTALPSTKDTAALRKWLVNKKAAQLKVRTNLNIMATYLSRGDKTLTDWLKHSKTLKKDGTDPLGLGL